MPPADESSLSYQLLLNVFVVATRSSLQVLTVFIFPLSTMVRMSDEQLKCNICGVVVNANQAKQHASSSSHESCRTKLEHELTAVRKDGYKDDCSVIVKWESATLR